MRYREVLELAMQKLRDNEEEIINISEKYGYFSELDSDQTIIRDKMREIEKILVTKNVERNLKDV